MDAIFNQYPWQLFIFKDKETPNIRFFGNDIRSVFEALKDELKPYKEGGKSMDDKAREQTLELRIYRIIREYVRQKAENKSGLKIEDFKKEKGSDGKEHIVYPQKYREETEKVCSDAFLAMRGRREKDFIEYYSGTIFSVPHFLPEEDYLAVSKALMEDWEKVKTLSMLALSANSYLPKQKETTLKEEE